jgi:hypothetical protein
MPKKAKSKNNGAKRGRQARWIGWYLRWVARHHPTAFCNLLGKMMPMQIKRDSHKEVVYRTVEEVQKDIIEQKLPLRRLAPLLIDMTKHNYSVLPEDDIEEIVEEDSNE